MLKMMIIQMIGDWNMKIKNYKIYLAHPILLRKEVRNWELEMEKKHGVNLYNPFYDSDTEFEKMAVNSLDSGNGCIDYTPELSHKIVQSDVDAIKKCDAVIAILSSKIFTIGTCMETVYATLNKKPVYVIIYDEDNMECRNHPISKHPWVQEHSTKIFENFKSFEDAMWC